MYTHLCLYLASLLRFLSLFLWLEFQPAQDILKEIFVNSILFDFSAIINYIRLYKKGSIA